MLLARIRSSRSSLRAECYMSGDGCHVNTAICKMLIKRISLFIAECIEVLGERPLQKKRFNDSMLRDSRHCLGYSSARGNR